VARSPRSLEPALRDAAVAHSDRRIVDRRASATRVQEERHTLVEGARVDVRANYFSGAGGAGLPNFAESTTAFACISLNCTSPRPSNQLVTMWNGIFTPFTAR
jgi:hypothetical protein